MTTFEDLKKAFSDNSFTNSLFRAFGMPETPAIAASRMLLEEMQQIYYLNCGGFITSAYSLEQVIEALNRLIAEYPVSGQITLAALSNREPELSKRFLELLIKGE